MNQLFKITDILTYFTYIECLIIIIKTFYRGGHADMWTELNENTVKDLYPAFFRSQEEQRVFKESFQQSFYFNRTVIQPTVNSN